MVAALAPPPAPAQPEPAAPVSRPSAYSRMTYAEFEAAGEDPGTRVEWLGYTAERRDGEPLGAVQPVWGYNSDGSPAVPTPNHSTIVTNLTLEIGGRVDRDAWRLDAQGMEFVLPTGRWRYPDLMLTPEPVVYEPRADGRPGRVANAAVVIEILSESTETVDLGEKRADYLSAPSVTDYLVIDQDEPLIWHPARGGTPAAPEWRIRRIEGVAETITLALPPLKLPLAAVYARVLPAG